MKLVGVKEFYNITRAKMISAANCCIVVAVCATATFAVDTALNSTTVEAQPIETTATTSLLPDQPDETSAEGSSAVDVTENIAETTAESSKASSFTAQTSVTSETSQTIASETTAEETTVQTTETTAAETTSQATEKITEKELYLVVYATTAVNVRSGPGTEYDIVKGLFAGDQIDVIAVTSNGWYKTYNGNYVKKEYTNETKPQAKSAPKPTQNQSAESTTRATTTTEAEVTTPAGESYTCTITFYGPQLLSDGSYSYSTATGTTCTEGRTVAADWSIFPPGTVIYIENDPLGGDGYYTVEDRGSGVQGYMIDIYADDGESGNYTTCTRTVIVK